MIFENQYGIRTYYEEYGEKSNPTVILIHGIGADKQILLIEPEIILRKYVLRLI